MEAEWCNRFTGEPCERPEGVPFLGLWHSRSGTPWVGTEEDLAEPSPSSEPSETLRQSLASLATSIRRLRGRDCSHWERVVPLDPTISSDLDLRDCEKALISSLPHLEILSHHPRSHLTVEEVREQVGRARRVSHRAITALSAHSEDWHGRTFVGVRPKRILAELRQDQWDIYENRAVATLRKRVLADLHHRLQKLIQILGEMDELSEHSAAGQGTRFRRMRLYKLWGEMFERQPSRDLLAKLISELDGARSRLLALADTHLFKQIPHFAAVSSPLHSTNVFQSDTSYRRAFDLWHRWESRNASKPPTPKERAEIRCRAVEDWDLFVTLLTIRACRQIGLLAPSGTAQPVALGDRILLERGWSVTPQADRSLLLQHSGKTHLQIGGLYCCLGAQAEAHLDAALEHLLQSSRDRHPLLLVAVHDPGSPAAPHSDALASKLSRLGSGTLMSLRLGLVAASPLRIDSTEQIARAILWVTAEYDWPRVPIRESIQDWAKAWPDLSKRRGLRISGETCEIFEPPSDSLLSEAEDQAGKAKLRLEKAIQDRAAIKDQEGVGRGDRRIMAEVNLKKKELTRLRDQAEEVDRILNRIHDAMVKARDSFQPLQRCPCCRSKRVAKEHGAMIMTCSDCRTEWGRRVCANCRQQYAFIVPHDPETAAAAETFDSVRMFGADMCAELLPPEAGSTLLRDTACPYCTDRLPVVKE